MKPAALIVALLSSAAGAGGERSAAAEAPSGFAGRWVAKRLSVGARVTCFRLEDTRRASENGYDNTNLEGNFLGSLWGLDARQHYFPNPFVEYRVASSFGVGLAYDQARARTLDWADDDERVVTAGDGDVEVRGLQAYVFGRYRNRTRFTTYASLGMAWYWSRFFESPGWSAPGRRFVVEDTNGWFVAVGCGFALSRHVGVDAMYRHSQVADVAARAYLHGNHYRAGAFPMRNDGLGVGVVYSF